MMILFPGCYIHAKPSLMGPVVLVTFVIANWLLRINIDCTSAKYLSSVQYTNPGTYGARSLGECPSPSRLFLVSFSKKWTILRKSIQITNHRSMDNPRRITYNQALNECGAVYWLSVWWSNIVRVSLRCIVKAQNFYLAKWGPCKRHIVSWCV